MNRANGATGRSSGLSGLQAWAGLLGPHPVSGAGPASRRTWSVRWEKGPWPFPSQGVGVVSTFNPTDL